MKVVVDVADAQAQAPRGPPLAALEFPGGMDPAPGWFAAHADLPPGPEERDFELRVSTPGGQRPPVCVSLWTTR